MKRFLDDNVDQWVGNLNDIEALDRISSQCDVLKKATEERKREIRKRSFGESARKQIKRRKSLKLNTQANMIKKIEVSSKIFLHFHSFKVAKTGRSTCRSCGNKIAQGLVRYGFQDEANEESPYVKYYHINCIPTMHQKETKPGDLDGFGFLSQDQKQQVTYMW